MSTQGDANFLALSQKYDPAAVQEGLEDLLLEKQDEEQLATTLGKDAQTLKATIAEFLSAHERTIQEQRDQAVLLAQEIRSAVRDNQHEERANEELQELLQGDRVAKVAQNLIELNAALETTRDFLRTHGRLGRLPASSTK